MSEYIVDVGDADELHFTAFQKRAEFCFGYPVREEIVRCRDCRKAYKADEMFFCKMFSAMVEPWRFCSWGEGKSESLVEFIEREGRKRDTND